MKFPYKKIPLQVTSSFFGTAILKPIIPVKLTFNGREVIYSALLDSGADFCIFDAEIGEYLGINTKTGIKIGFGGIQERGGAVATLSEIILSIGGNQFKTIVGFSADIAKHGYGILGQKGFFNLFTLKFDYRKAEVEIKAKTEIN